MCSKVSDFLNLQSFCISDKELQVLKKSGIIISIPYFWKTFNAHQYDIFQVRNIIDSRSTDGLLQHQLSAKLFFASEQFSILKSCKCLVFHNTTMYSFPKEVSNCFCYTISPSDKDLTDFQAYLPKYLQLLPNA